MLTKYLTVFFISMVPVVELRGALPVAVGLNLPLLPSYLICILGNMLPVPFIFFFARRVLEWGAQKPLLEKPFNWILRKGQKGGEKLMEKVGGSTYVALLIFVGIPLPGTGAWTGTLAASILDLDFRKSVVACMGGVLMAGIIMAVLSTGVFSLIRIF